MPKIIHNPIRDDEEHYIDSRGIKRRGPKPEVDHDAEKRAEYSRERKMSRRSRYEGKKLSFKDFLTVDYKPGSDELIKKNAKKRKREEGETNESTQVRQIIHKRNPHPMGSVRTVNKPGHELHGKKVTVNRSRRGNWKYGLHGASPENSLVSHQFDSKDLVKESTKEYGKSVDRAMDKKKRDNISDSDKEKLAKLHNLMQKEGMSIAQRRAMGRQMRRLAPRIKIAREKAMRKTATTETIRKRAKRQARNELFKKLTKGKSKGEVSLQRRQEVEKRLDKLSGRIEKMAKKMIPKVRKQDRERKANRNKKNVKESTLLEFNYVPREKLPKNVLTVIEKIRKAAGKKRARPRISVSKQGRVHTIEVEVNNRDLMDDDAFLDSMSQDIVKWDHKTIKIELMNSQHPAPKYTV